MELRMLSPVRMSFETKKSRSHNLDETKNRVVTGNTKKDEAQAKTGSFKAFGLKLPANRRI